MLTLVAEVALFALITVSWHADKESAGATGLAIGATLTPFFMAHSLVVSKRKFLAALAGSAVASMALLFLLTHSWLSSGPWRSCCSSPVSGASGWRGPRAGCSV